MRESNLPRERKRERVATELRLAALARHMISKAELKQWPYLRGSLALPRTSCNACDAIFPTQVWMIRQEARKTKEMRLPIQQAFRPMAVCGLPYFHCRPPFWASIRGKPNIEMDMCHTVFSSGINPRFFQTSLGTDND